MKARFEQKGLAGGARSILDEVQKRIVDRDRELIVLSLDLADPKAQPTEREAQRYQFELRDFGPETFPQALAMLERSEPQRIDSLRTRLANRTPGFVIFEQQEAVAFCFYQANSPDRPPHPDLSWLGIKLADREVYCFDSFIPVALRGRGIAVLRLTYQELNRRGFQTARGYVFSWDTAPLWSYRVTGWTEYNRVTEHRFLGRFAVVDHVLYRLNRFDRTRLLRLPSSPF